MHINPELAQSKKECKSIRGVLLALVGSKMPCASSHHFVAETTVVVLTSPAENMVVTSVLVIHLLAIRTRPSSSNVGSSIILWNKLLLLQLQQLLVELELPAVDFNLV